MMQDDGRRYYIPPPRIKERTRHYPDGHTKHQAASAHDRHRLLGNSWLGVARLLLALILAHTGTATANIIPPDQVPRSPHQSTLDKMIEWANVQPALPGPGPVPVIGPIVGRDDPTPMEQ